MIKKIKKDISGNYQKIRTVCQIMIDDLTDKVINSSIDDEVKLWKSDDSALEILTKLVSVLIKLENNNEDEKLVNKITKSISKNDYLALSEFIKTYDVDKKI